MTVLVAMPYFGCPDLVHRAVESVLNQTVKDLALVVIGDGEDPPLGSIRDPRLTVFRLTSNHGPYFAQAVALAANPFDWYAPHAADDWSDPDHLERLLLVGQPTVVSGCYWRHEPGKTPRRVERNLEVGVYQTDVLRVLGGYNPAERVGQDSMLLQTIRAAGYSLNPTKHPTYHYVKRPESLTRRPETGHKSLFRRSTIARNRAILSQVHHVAFKADEIGKLRASFVPALVTAQVEHYAERLRAELA